MTAIAKAHNFASWFLKRALFIKSICPIEDSIAYFMEFSLCLNVSWRQLFL